jgi:predicted Rossmann fold nucleotide-binding protein DprA/Smf involved in DNA uptake
MLLDWYCTDKRTADRLGQTFTAENIKMLRYLDYTEPIPYVRGIGMLYPPPQKYLEEKNKSSKDDKEAENSNKKTAGSKRLFSIQPDEKDSEAIKKQAEKQKTAVEQLTETLRTVYDTISETPKNAIQISAELSMNSYEVLALLTELELNGLIVHQGYGQYIRK